MNRIKTKEANKGVVKTLTQNRFQFKDGKTIAQIAIAYSIQLNVRFTSKDFENLDNKGMEYPETLLGEINKQSNDGIYKAVFNQHYKKKLSNDEFTKYVKLHLDYGLERLGKDLLQDYKGRNVHIDYLISIIDKGVSLISTPHSSYTKYPKTENKVLEAFENVLDIELGLDSETGEKISIRINDENYFDSQHFAIAGMNGSGKTQLIQDILFQISEQSNQQLKFIFFDYKGEGNSSKLQEFLNATNCDFIDIQQKSFKFNPLTSISLSNERDRKLQIAAFRDKLSSVDKRLGAKQKNNLAIAIRDCFDKTVKEGRHPTLSEVYHRLLEMYDESNLGHDSLIAIMKDISDLVFADDYDPKFSFNKKSLYVNLPPTLPDTARKASVFMMLNCLFNFYISSNDVEPSKNRIKPIRYIIVIDEAHAYLKEKSMASVLVELLRMIRSKGVIVMMLSQGIEEYKQKDFDFSSQVKIPIMLNVQNKSTKIAKSFLGTPKSEKLLENNLKKLEKAKGIINFNEPRLIDINMFWRRKF